MSEFTAPSVEELQERFPSHEIESFIAQGGMGAVYLATQTSLDRPVAIKILPQEFGEDLDYRASFETEAKAMARLNHNNLVGIYDFGDINGMLFIIMEYIPGRSLFDTAHGQQVDQLEAASLIRDMCNGLDHAHSAGMLHRDIKPANVLIDDEAKPKIVDFGLARPLGEEQTEGVVFGTPGYTAPEVLSNPFAVDQRSDIFSMGVMLYEMLTGHLPADPIIPASSVSGSDRRFDTILNKAIHPDPAQRYSSSGEMAAGLEALIKQFEQAPGLLTSGDLARRSTVLGGRALKGSSMAGVLPSPKGRPVLVNSSSGSKTGLILGLVAALVVGVIAIVSMGGDDKPKGPTTAELKAIELNIAREAKDVEEKRMAIVARKKREVRELREKEEMAAKRREKQKQTEALSEKKRKQEEERFTAIEEEKRATAAAAAADAARSKKQLPVYDHESFIAKLRINISVRAATRFRDHREETDKILDREERDAKRAVRRSTSGAWSDALEGRVAEFFKEWKKDGAKPVMPADMPSKAEIAINEFIAEIAKIDAKLLRGLSRYQATYAKELSKKSQLLERGNVTASVTAIKAELAALDKKGYFLAIVKSEDPSPSTFTEKVVEVKRDNKDEGGRRRREFR